MPLKIYRTGLEQYAPGGSARLRVLILGDGDTGKTRWSSYAPRPIYAACEPGIAAIADRQMPAMDIHTSSEMMELLRFLQRECRKPDAMRDYQTLVIDTFDAYARNVKLEWAEGNGKEIFTGREAWAFLDQKLNILLTWLMRLDMNVIVLAHLKDKTTKDDDSGRESHELMIRLQGQNAESIYDDFDLVGLMDYRWVARSGERVRQRSLTFHKTPKYPMLKDRLALTPEYLDVNFEDSDWEKLFARLQERIDSLRPVEIVEEITVEDPDVVPPSKAGAGPVPQQALPQIDLTKLDRAALADMCKSRGVTTTADGLPIRGNTIKAELVAALEKHAQSGTAGMMPVEGPAPARRRGRTAKDVEVPEVLPTPDPEPAPEPEPTPEPEPAATETVAEPEGQVDPATGELVQENDPQTVSRNLQDQAVELVAKELGATVISDEGTDPPDAAPAVAPQPPPPPAPASAAAVELARAEAASQATERNPRDYCEACDKFIGENSGENPNFVRIAWIRYRKALCNDDLSQLTANR